MRAHATKKTLTREAWADDKDFLVLSSGAYHTKKGVTLTLNAPIIKVRDVLAKALKPNRKLVSVVKFTNGQMEEIRPAKEEGVAPTSPPKTSPLLPAAAATVAAPAIGCPVPEFPESEIRATRVLEVFLTPEQLRDYNKHGAFVAKGADTGHHYAITHRERRSQMQSRSFRSLYDLTEKRALCVHDWTVPAPEEMLALLFCVTLPGNEDKIRILPDTFPPPQ